MANTLPPGLTVRAPQQSSSLSGLTVRPPSTAPATDTVTFMAGGPRGPSGMRTVPKSYIEENKGLTIAQGAANIPQSIDDMVRDWASKSTVGAIDKLAAAAESSIKGTPYEEEIKRQRKLTSEATERIGPVASGLNLISASLAGGVATKGISPLQRFGTAAYDKLGKFGGSIANAGLAAMEGAAWGAAGAAGMTDDPAQMQKNIKEGAKAGAILGSTVQLGGDLLSKVVSPVSKSLSPQQQKLVNTLKTEGVPLTAGQETGKKSLLAAEEVAKSLPGGQKFLRANPEEQARAYNRAVLSKAGINSDAATPEVLQEAANRFSNEYEAIAARNTINVDKNLLQSLDATARRYARKIPSQQRPVLENFINDIRSAKAIPGSTYQAARSDARRLAKSSTDPMLADAFREVRDALDGAFERSIPAGSLDAEVFKDLNKRYANFKIIDDAMSGVSPEQQVGNIIPQRLSAAIKSRSKTALSRGDNEITNLARAGSVIFKPQGQARTTTSDILSRVGAFAPYLAPIGGLAAYQQGYIDPYSATGLLLAPMLTTNPVTQAYLRNQLGRSIPTPAITSAITRAAPMSGLLSGTEERR